MGNDMSLKTRNFNGSYIRKHLRQFNTPYAHLDGHVANLLDGGFVNFEIVKIVRTKWKRINIILILLKTTRSIIDHNC